MTKTNKLQKCYLLLALIGLVVTWFHNVHYLAPHAGGLGQFVMDTMVNHASRSITLDIIVLFIVCCIFMIKESRKLGMKKVWVYIILGLAVAISVAFPLFLFFREFRLKEVEGE